MRSPIKVAEDIMNRAKNPREETFHVEIAGPVSHSKETRVEALSNAVTQQVLPRKSVTSHAARKRKGRGGPSKRRNGYRN